MEEYRTTSIASSFSEFDPLVDVVVIVAARDRAGHHTRNNTSRSGYMTFQARRAPLILAKGSSSAQAQP
jgi:hypothetical protein